MVGYRLSICLIPFHAPAFLPRQQEERPVEHPEILKREIKTLVFDQYGTVVDMQGGLTEAAAPFLKAKGWHDEPHRFQSEEGRVGQEGVRTWRSRWSPYP